MNFVEFLKQHYGFSPRQTDRYGEWLGYTIQELNKDTGSVVTSLPVREEHLSPSGAVHGGVISGFLDFTCGCAVFTSLKKTELCSTVELNVKYFKPLKSGEKVIAKAEVINRGRSLCSVLAKMYKESDSDNPVALATGTFNIYEPKRF